MSNKQKSLGRPKSIEKRQQILDSAGDLMLSLGYKGTSMEAVAKASGVSKQTVYSHFTNKERLYSAIIENKCVMYQLDQASLCIETQSLQDTLSIVALSFLKLLNDDNVIAMYKVVIGESKQDSKVAELFYEAGLVHSFQLVTKLLMRHPQCQLPEAHAKEAAQDFFNLLKSDFHMRSLLHLPYSLDAVKQNALAKKVAAKTIAIMPLLGH